MSYNHNYSNKIIKFPQERERERERERKKKKKKKTKLTNMHLILIITHVFYSLKSLAKAKGFLQKKYIQL